MNDGYITLIVVGSILVYGFVAGITWALMPEKVKRHRFYDGETMLEPAGVLGPLFWPIFLPFLLAGALVNYLKNRPKRNLPTARVIPSKKDAG